MKMTQGSIRCVGVWPSKVSFDSVLQRTDQISQTKVDEQIVEQHIVVVDQMVCLLRIRTPRQQFELNVNAYDKETLDNLSSAFNYVLSALKRMFLTGLKVVNQLSPYLQNYLKTFWVKD